jgi:hypothetical protein
VKYVCNPSQKLEEFTDFMVVDPEDNETYAPSTLVSSAFQEGSLLLYTPRGM